MINDNILTLSKNIKIQLQLFVRPDKGNNKTKTKTKLNSIQLNGTKTQEMNN